MIRKTIVYITWIVLELGLAGFGKKRLKAFGEFKLLAKRYVLKRRSLWLAKFGYIGKIIETSISSLKPKIFCQNAYNSQDYKINLDIKLFC